MVIITSRRHGLQAMETGTALSNIEEGQLVKIMENGTPVEFYVAKHDYESGLNGAGRTLLVRKDLHSYQVWNASLINAYAGSSIDSWLNSTYKNSLNADIRSLIGNTKFRCTIGAGNWSVITLTRDVFILSHSELGYSSLANLNQEGNKLPISSTLRKAKFDGAYEDWWLRTASSSSERYYVAYVDKNGTSNAVINCDSSGICARPCFTLPSTVKVADDGTISG